MVPDRGDVEPGPGRLRLRRAESRAAVVPLVRRCQAPAESRVVHLLSQHHVALAQGAGLRPRATVFLMLFGLTGNKLQVTVLAGDQPQSAFRALVKLNLIFSNLQTTFAFNLCVFLFLVLLHVQSGHRLLAHVAQGDVPSTVDLMCGEICFRNIMLAVATYLGAFVAHGFTLAKMSNSRVRLLSPQFQIR